jgi:hypothetical protein
VITSSGSIGARLNRLAPTRAHREATIVAGIGTFFDIFDIFLTGVLGTVLIEEFDLGRAALPPLLASGFVGMFVGHRVGLHARLRRRAGRRPPGTCTRAQSPPRHRGLAVDVRGRIAWCGDRVGTPLTVAGITTLACFGGTLRRSRRHRGALRARGDLAVTSPAGAGSASSR